MQNIADLELPYLAFEEMSFREDPFTPFDQARAQHPWLAKCSFAYVLTQYDAIRELMEFDEKMALGYAEAVDLLGATGTGWGDFIKNAVQTQIGERHARLRSAVFPAFTPREANRHRPIMREEMSRLLNEWGPQGAFDFEIFASYYPVSVMCRIIGASPDVVPDIRSSLEILGLGGSFEPSYVPRFVEAFEVVDGFVRGLVADRRAGKRIWDETDLLDRLLEITDSGGLSDEELFNLLVFLFTGGYDTSKNVLSLIMYLLIDRPEIYEKCAEDMEYCHKVVNETFRYHGVASSPRVLLDDIVLRDVLFPKGTMVFTPWSVAGRDPGKFSNADVFDPDREREAPIMPFGLGPHMCLGQYLARAQIEEGLHLLAQRMKKPQRAGENGWREFVGVWGVRGLPIAFDYVPEREEVPAE